MAETWKTRCPIGEDSPDRRQAWRRGWQYRKEQGPGTPKMETAAEMAGKPGLLEAWLQGYAAADGHFTGPEPRTLRL
ncbi:hypothetical protein [Salinibacter grassmerensis]|uniref:hypothetical protein n=1 Tax=Salinibacter grassmerensis TaxID=3040353 RepID=UPI0021E97E26|nr:hypothetical protein [Salinibacter grassmerensis]